MCVCDIVLECMNPSPQVVFLVAIKPYSIGLPRTYEPTHRQGYSCWTKIHVYRIHLCINVYREWCIIIFILRPFFTLKEPAGRDAGTHSVYKNNKTPVVYTHTGGRPSTVSVESENNILIFWTVVRENTHAVISILAPHAQMPVYPTLFIDVIHRTIT